MTLRHFIAILALLTTSACATGGALAPESSLAGIVNDARMGSIDACRDPRWVEWRFEHGEEGVARLTALRKQAMALASSLEAASADDPLLGPLKRARLTGLQQIIRAVLATPDPESFRSALAAQEERVAEWKSEAAAAQGADLALMAARRSVWRRASSLTERDMSGDRIVEGLIATCLYGPDEAQAQLDAVQLVIAALERNHWPSDEVDGEGATVEVLGLRGSDLGRAYLKRNIKRLDAAATRETIPRGGWEYLRLGLELDANPSSFAKRFSKAVVQVRRFYASLPAPRSVAEDLWRRVRVDQFAIGAESLLIHKYPRSKARERAKLVTGKAIAENDTDNTRRMKVLLQDRDWFDDTKDGEGASRDGWLLVQHADQYPEWQREVLRRMELLVGTGRISRERYAYLWDRVAVAEKRPQRYGSQMGCSDGKDGKRPVRQDLEDPDRLDKRRKEMGLGSWDGYAASFGPCT